MAYFHELFHYSPAVIEKNYDILYKGIGIPCPRRGFKPGRPSTLGKYSIAAYAKL